VKNIIVDLIINDQKWNTESIFKDYKIIFENIIKETLNFLQIKLPKNSIIELSVILTDDKEIQAINKEYRNKDKPTNVLSFQVIPDDLESEIKKQPHLLLGDIFMSFDTLKCETKEQGKLIQDHFTHLFLHSFLHLLGYDHIDDFEAELMEDLEVKILNKLGIVNPYL
jgi:probable rRNA maturation factor